MAPKCDNLPRRDFLNTAAAAALGVLLTGALAWAERFTRDMLQAWSCGGLAEAMTPASQLYQDKPGVRIAYSGAFAAALGKSLLSGTQTEVFAVRVLGLSKKLRQADKMIYFKLLCFTSYVLAMLLGNPARIKGVEDLARPGVWVVLAPEASPPGRTAATIVLKKAGVLEQAEKNMLTRGACVQRTMEDLVSGKSDVSVVELRVTRLVVLPRALRGDQHPRGLLPAGAPDLHRGGYEKRHGPHNLANDYVELFTSAERQGFIPAISQKGQTLVEKLGVKDV